MKKLHFICTFESNIVLHASSNTEGKVEKLDYIPGSNFLGMVARDYAGFASDAFNVFHSGKVCFGDGHILVDGSRTLAMPFSFQVHKGISFKKAVANKELFVHHHLTNVDFDEAITKGKQLKQQRAGFFTANGTLADYEHSYKQKSAYDKKKRRSRESYMFGYYALPNETRWAFTVTVDDSMSKYEETIKDLLVSANRLGKSKSAEYGLVKIAFEREETLAPYSIKIQTINAEQYLYLYAKSRLVLTDANGINSYTPSIESLGFEDSDAVSIDWAKSQIRTSRYTPYVGARRNFDPERLVIDKGSVIVVEIGREFNIEAFSKRIQRPIGLYISEGHGEVIVNPSWLLAKNVIFTPNTNATSTDTSTNPSNPLNNWLTSQRATRDSELDLLKDVQEFIEDNASVKNKKSQWGQIRSRCRASKTNEDIYLSLFSEEIENGHKKGFLLHGKAEKKWDNGLIEKLKSMYDKRKKDDADYLNFMKLLSIYAPKADDKGGE